MPSGNRPAYIVPVLTLLLMTSCGCDLGETPPAGVFLGPQLTAIVDGKQVNFLTNESFSVDVDLAADAGYQWHITFTDSTVVHLEGESYRPKRGNWNQEGGATVATYYFRTLKPGQCSIMMEERQGWLKDAPALHSFWFAVAVHN